ncbi:hypothetical protein LSH36_87g02008 [Paralvinella palmiformis]|uniref:Sushi domain-containing protein n=1 Tax=Paralvinella palmiformis TaxID=53620 RepID=A0AAD9K1A0_9ANNE|nr:hypothetical protein LSH36_87g02008 [Paralvinella palmiformis]
MFIGLSLSLLTVASLARISETVNCLKPDLTARQYSISTEAESYSPGYEFNVICRPGYKDGGMGLMVCQSDGVWGGAFPSCTNYYPELSVPWYGVLIVIFSLMIGISCAVPRLWFWIRSLKKVKVAPAEKIKLQDYFCEKSETPNLEMKKHLPWFKTNRVRQGPSVLPPIMTPFAEKHHKRAKNSLKF